MAPTTPTKKQGTLQVQASGKVALTKESAKPSSKNLGKLFSTTTKSRAIIH